MGNPFKISPLRKNWKSNSSPWLWQKQKTGEQPTLVPLLPVYSAELSPKAKTKGLEAPRRKGRWLAHTVSSLMGQNMASTTKGQNNCHFLYLSVQCNLNQCRYQHSHHLQAQFEDCHLLVERLGHTTPPCLSLTC